MLQKGVSKWEGKEQEIFCGCPVTRELPVGIFLLLFELALECHLCELLLCSVSLYPFLL